MDIFSLWFNLYWLISHRNFKNSIKIPLFGLVAEIWPKNYGRKSMFIIISSSRRSTCLQSFSVLIFFNKIQLNAFRDFGWVQSKLIGKISMGTHLWQLYMCWDSAIKLNSIRLSKFTRNPRSLELTFLVTTSSLYLRDKMSSLSSVQTFDLLSNVTINFCKLSRTIDPTPTGVIKVWNPWRRDQCDREFVPGNQLESLDSKFS